MTIFIGNQVCTVITLDFYFFAMLIMNSNSTAIPTVMKYAQLYSRTFHYFHNFFVVNETITWEKKNFLSVKKKKKETKMKRNKESMVEDCAISVWHVKSDGGQGTWVAREWKPRQSIKSLLTARNHRQREIADSHFNAADLRPTVMYVRVYLMYICALADIGLSQW